MGTQEHLRPTCGDGGERSRLIAVVYCAMALLAVCAAVFIGVCGSRFGLSSETSRSVSMGFGLVGLFNLAALAGLELLYAFLDDSHE
ncbi:MAG: hypothetical protein KJ622_05095 [Alphaproteobacteria bacterium]|nr:hypothetical protein [Alphaproteobacteria bacterium]